MATVFVENRTKKMPQIVLTEEMLLWKCLVGRIKKENKIRELVTKKLLSSMMKLDDCFRFVFDIEADIKSQILYLHYSSQIWEKLFFNDNEIPNCYCYLSDFAEKLINPENEAEYLFSLKEEICEALKKKMKECEDAIENAEHSLEYTRGKLDDAQRLLVKREKELEERKGEEKEQSELTTQILRVLQ